MRVNVAVILEGVPQLLRAIEMTNTATHARTIAAVRRGTEAVTAVAKSRAPRVSGELAASIRAEYAKDGLTGFVRAGMGRLPRRSQASTQAHRDRLAAKRSRKGTRAGKGSYAPVVERGDPRRHHHAHPFMIPAFKAQESMIRSEIAQATVDGAKAGGML